MKKFFKYLFRTILILTLLLLVLPFLIYLPAVQRYAKKKAVEYVEQHMGLKAAIGNFSLKFPFRVELDEVFAGRSYSDTLLYTGHMHLDIGLSGVFRKELSVENLSVQEIRLDHSDTLTGMQLKVNVLSLQLIVPWIKLNEKQVMIRNLRISKGDVVLIGGKEKVVTDSLESRPFDWFFDIERLDLERLRYTMNTSALPLLFAQVDKGYIVNGGVNIGQQWVRVDSVDIGSGECIIKTSSTTSRKSPLKNEDKNALQDTIDRWVVEAGTLAVTDYAFIMEPEQERGFELKLSHIGIRFDSVYNRGAEIRGILKDLRLVRQEGGEIESMSADIDLRERKSEVTGGYIRTPNSVIRLNAVADGAVSEIINRIPLKVRLEASVGMKDVALFWPGVPKQMEGQKVNVNAVLSYQSDQVKISRLIFVMPGNFRLEGKGEVNSLQNITALTGKLSLQGKLESAGWADELLKDKMALPSGLAFTLNAEADKGKIRPDIRLSQGDGSIRITGVYHLPDTRYDLQLKADTFPLASFLPSDSLGFITAGIELKGHGLQLSQANAQLTADIQALEYKRHVYRDIRFAAGVANARLTADLKSMDPDLLFDMKVQADSIARRYFFRLAGRVEKANLKALHWAAEELEISLNADINASIGPSENYFLNADISEVFLNSGGGKQDLGGALVRLNSDLRHTELDLFSGDFRLHFQGDTVITKLSTLFTALAAGLQQQIARRYLDMTQLQGLLPRFKLEVNGHTNNVIGKYLKAKKIVFKDINMWAEASPEEGVYLSAEIIRPLIREISLDSVTLRVNQQEKGIKYDLDVISSDGEMKNLHHVSLSGEAEKNELRVLLHQQNREGKTGVNIGAAIALEDSSVQVRMFPSSPVLGYSYWSLNEENRIVFYPDYRIEADLSLQHQEKLFRLQSYREENQRERLKIEIKGIDLSAVSHSIPFIPDLSGRLNTDILLFPERAHFEADGMLAIDSFSFEGKKIGDLELDLDYDIKEKLTRHTVDFALHLDGIKRILAKGSFSTSALNREVDLKLDLPSLPLRLINVFVPDNLIVLFGDLYGEMNLSGTLDRPSLDGQLAFRDGSAEIVMLGTRFGLDTVMIPVVKGAVGFRDFGITAPNKKRLEIAGEVRLLPFEEMNCDVSLEAHNFQVVNVKKNETSIVYGKAYVDLGVELRGPFNALDLTGNVNLLNNTVLDYVLRNSSPALKDHAQDLVRFVSFRDSTLSEKDDLTNHINTGSFAMKLLVEIGEAVSMNINLSEDGNNRISIQGGGNLIYSMNPENGNSLVGKYILNGGMVRYGVPVVGEKNFTIQNGSYVEWTGNLLDPMLHITAATAVRVSVTEDNQSSRIVNFEVLIRIEGDLRQPKITFDLTAPNDQAIQTQLAAFSAEERTKQAMNLLIYGTYTGPGTVNTGSNANNTLNNFVEKELNQWTRKYIKNSSLTFGIDTYNQIGADGQEVKRTDYSYQFSKQLFNDKVNVKVGGRISSDNDPGTSMEDNLIDDIAIEYRFTKKRNLFLKVFRHTNYESVLEGEVTQTGIGVVWRKSFRRLKEIFKGKKEKSGTEN